MRYRLENLNLLPAAYRDQMSEAADIALKTYTRYFNIPWSVGGTDLRIIVTTDNRYGPTMWCPQNSRRIYVSNQIGGNMDTFRRTFLHELTHYYGLYWHQYQELLRGNRLVDIGGQYASLTDIDVANLHLHTPLRSNGKKPSQETDPVWWLPEPTVLDDTFNVKGGEPVWLNIFGNDQFSRVALPILTKRGVLINQANPSQGVYYTPPTNFEDDEFEYTIIAPWGKSGKAGVSLSIEIEKEDHSWTNPDNKFDVNKDGRTTARDALIIINALNRGEEVDPSKEPTYFYDVNGDGILSATDAAQVINELNRKNR